MLALEAELAADVDTTLYALSGMLSPHNGEIFFEHVDESGATILRTDGTPAGTTPLTTSQFPGGQLIDPTQLHDHLDRLYFLAGTESNGKEPWVSDGTPEGTRPLGDFTPGPTSTDRASYHDFNGTVFIATSSSTADTTLWRLDDVDGEPQKVEQFDDSARGLSFLGYRSTGALFLFNTYDSSGSQLWSSDGTDEGTFQIHTFDSPSGSHGKRLMGQIDGIWYFAAREEATGLELYRTDGTPEGTWLVTDINPGQGHSVHGYSSAKFDGAMYFSAYDDSSASDLWKSDGTKEGTVRLVDREPSDASGNPASLTLFDDKVFYICTSSDGIERTFSLCKSDGTEDGTTEIVSLGPGVGPRNIDVVSGMMFFSLGDATAGVQRLWQSDGTAEGTRLATDLVADDGRLAPESMVVAGLEGQLIFRAWDDAGRMVLYKLAPPPGDTNFDGLVDLVDFTRLKTNFGREVPNLAGDLNWDDKIDLEDFNILKENFG